MLGLMSQSIFSAPGSQLGVGAYNIPHPTQNIQLPASGPTGAPGSSTSSPPNSIPPTPLSSAPSNSGGPANTNVNSTTITLRIQNLPRDITPREFRVLFTFAENFVSSELQKSQSVAEDGLPISVVGFAYFKTFASASHAMSVLDMRSDIFGGPLFGLGSGIGAANNASNPPNLPGQYSPSSNSSTNSSPNLSFKAHHHLPLKCDIRASSVMPRAGDVPRSRFAFANINEKETNDPASITTNITTSSTSAPAAAAGPSTNSAGPAPSSSNPSSQHPAASAQHLPPSAAPPHPGPMSLDMPPIPAFPNTGPPSTSLFSPTSPRSLFPLGQQPISAPETPAKEHASPFGMSTIAGRPSGRSLLLESQGREDDGFSSLVHDSSRFFNREPSNASFMPYGGPPPPAGPPTAGPPGSSAAAAAAAAAKSWTDKRRASSSAAAMGPTARQFHSLSISGPSIGAPTGMAAPAPAGAPPSAAGPIPIPAGPAPANAAPGPPTDPSKMVVAYSPTNNTQAMHILQSGGRVLPPANPADQNPPCNTLYVGNLPPDTLEEELKDLFSSRPGYKRLCFRTKANGPMCFVEFEDVLYATRALEELYGYGLSNSVKGGIRLSYSKNPLGVRGPNSNSNANNNNNANPGNNPNNANNSNGGAGHMNGSSSRNSISGPVPPGLSSRYQSSKPGQQF